MLQILPSKKTIFVFLLLFSNLFVIAQGCDFRNYNVEDGLAESQVLSICQDRNGYIWFGTNGQGVSKYDGIKFTTVSENDSLANNVVLSIVEAKNGNLLFGTNFGLSIYNGITFKNFTQKNGLPNDHVFKVMEDRKGTIWLGMGQGVCQMINEKFIPFTKDTVLNKSMIWTEYADKTGNIWFGTAQNGAVKYNPVKNIFSYYSIKNGFLSYSNFIKTINEDEFGNIYLGTVSGICMITPEGIHKKVNINEEESIGFTSIVSDMKNNLWFASSLGIYKFNGHNFKQFTSKNGLPNNEIISALADREGNIWFGTNGFGISKFQSETFTYYTVNNNLPADNINAIFQDSKKNMWIGFGGFGVCKIENNIITTYKLDLKNLTGSLADNEVQAICEDNKGNMYFGTKDGISIYNGKTFRNYKDNSGLSANSVYSIIRDKKDVIWIGTKNGLCYFKGDKIENIELLNKYKNNKDLPIYCIYEDNKGDLWLSTEDGIIKYNEKTIEKYGKKEGFTDKRVLSIVQDKQGNMWFATDEGVFGYDGNKFINITINDGLSANKVYLVQVDNNGFLWAGTPKGIDKINIQKFNLYKTIEIKNFTKDDGFRGIECNRNAQFKDSEGKIWFGTIKGVTIYNPLHFRANKQEALTHINGIRLFFKNEEDILNKYSKGIDKSTHLPKNLILPYNQNHITFDFFAICLTNPNKVRYQFKLDGADKDWFPATTKTEATYSSLPAGDYVFYLKAMNNEGIWNKNPIVYKFTILPPWWKTWWFYTFAAIIAISGIYAFIYTRTLNLQKAKILLENEVELRTHELREEKEKVERINEEVIEQKAIIEAKNNDITDSIKYAKNIQEALLPPLQNVFNELKDAFVLYMPKDIVSGDFYWFAKRNNKRFIASVDCTGHGVPGAFMSIIGNTLLNEIITEKNITEPGEILNELHIGIKAALKQSNSENERRDGMDIALCSINEENNQLEFAGANRPLWIFRKNAEKENAHEIIKANKFPIGGLEMEQEVKRKFTNHIIPVQKGDAIYVFSDGYADQFGGERGKKFMLGNLQKLMNEIYYKPIKEQKEILQNAFVEWKGTLEQVDDVLIIGFRIL